MSRAASRCNRPTAMALLTLLIVLPAFARAQQALPPPIEPGRGTIKSNDGQPMVGSMSNSTLEPITFKTLGSDNQPPGPAYESNVSFIDSAVPMTQIRLLFDANYDDRRPTRAEFLFPKSGTPGSPGWLKPEDRVDWQQLTTYAEFAYENLYSGFLEIPTKWVNPDINDNNVGLGDVNLGVKMTVMQTAGLTTAVQLRATIPTRVGPGLSSDHYSIEPGFLFYLRPIPWMAFEGEVRYSASLSGSDYAGDFVRYGLGVSFLERDYNDFWAAPVFELVGWSILSGQEMVPDSGSYTVRSAAGDTIVNAMAGVRFGFGDNGDIYTGCGHSLTSDAWAQFFWRVEFRVRF
jgi:hypothetical protein